MRKEREVIYEKERYQRAIIYMNKVYDCNKRKEREVKKNILREII